MLGETVSHYRILAKLGTGGMGVVYEAEDTRLGRIVALKFLPRDVATDGDARRRFLHEARAASALDHPNICSLYDIGETDDGRMFLVMARYQGETLRARLNRGALSLEEVIDFAIQIAKGLAAAHQKGIVHRDVKPENVLVTEDGVVKILDFGLAMLEGASRLTHEGAAVGTIAYMAPEQAEGAAVDHRTDVWALGVLVYELATGKHPFSGQHLQAMIRSILQDDPPPISPPELDRIARKAVAKAPRARYSRIDDMLAELAKLEGVLDSRRVTVSAESDRRSRKSGYFYVAAVLVFMLSVAALWTFFQGESNGEVESIAVLPLDNLTGDPEQEYFVEGMHEALIANLSRISALRVISRTSTMSYRRTDKPMPEIARELDVDVLVEGSVLRDGARVRITAQLIEGSSDKHLWASSYDRDFRDVLGLVSEVAGEITREIEVVLTPAEQERLSRTPVVSPAAHDEYLRGRYAFYSMGEGFRTSLSHYDRALEIDPGFAAAHAGKAQAYFTLGYFGMEPRDEMIPLARAAAEKALSLDDGLVEARSTMGWIHLYVDWDWPDAEREFLRALESNPSDAFARHGYGDYLTVTGRAEEGARQVLLGRQVDPRSLFAALPVPAHVFFARRYDEAIEEFEALVERYPEAAGIARSLQADALWSSGRRDEALQLLRDIWKDDEGLLSALDRGYESDGPRGAVLAAAETLDERSKDSSESPHRIAGLYAKGENAVRTLEWLETALRDRSPATLHTLANPVFDFLRERSDFRELRQRFGLP